MSEQSAEAKVKLTIYARGLLKHNLRSQNIKFTTTENIWGIGRFSPNKVLAQCQRSQKLNLLLPKDKQLSGAKIIKNSYSRRDKFYQKLHTDI